jgi:hypothetical protein
MMVLILNLRIESLRRSKSGSEKAQCDIIDCEFTSKRSISAKKVETALPNLKFNKSGKKVHLCKEHYKQLKKATKTDRKIETLTWD